jgi:hypothetical protein
MRLLFEASPTLLPTTRRRFPFEETIHHPVLHLKLYIRTICVPVRHHVGGTDIQTYQPNRFGR